MYKTKLSVSFLLKVKIPKIIKTGLTYVPGRKQYGYVNTDTHTYFKSYENDPIKAWEDHVGFKSYCEKEIQLLKDAPSKEMYDNYRIEKNQTAADFYTFIDGKHTSEYLEYIEQARKSDLHK